MPTHLQIITLDRVTYEDDVDLVVLPGIDGQLGVLPQHAPIVTALQAGEIMARKSGEEAFVAVSGGFVQVSPESVVVLADAAEHAEEIDAERAEEAVRRARERIAEGPAEVDLERALGSLRRAQARLDVSHRRRRRGTGVPERDTPGS